jgi:2-succinyl-5-enolpyruvyl-6-hydroxy-3-cyclohexene-1-carboxylate synthase
VGPNSWSQKEKTAFYSWANYCQAMVWFEAAAGLEPAKLPAGSSNKIWFSMEQMPGEINPDLLVQWGAPLVMRAFSRWRNNQKQKFILVDNWEENRDPTKSFHEKIMLSPEEWSSSPPHGEKKSKWTSAAIDWIRNQTLEYEKIINKLPEKAELGWARALNQAWIGQKEKLQIFIGNSMPIRDFLQFSPSQSAVFSDVFSQRGLSGIDGNFAFSAGLQKGIKKPLVIVVGDLTAYHDLNSLHLLKQQEQDLFLLIINNAGGEIFRVVDTNAWRKQENIFTTPVNVSWQNAAATFSLPYEECKSLDQLQKRAELWRKNGGKLLVEFKVDANVNRAARESLGQKT